MKSKLLFLWSLFALVAILVAYKVFVGGSQWKLRALSNQLRTATTHEEATDLCRGLLHLDDPRARDVVSAYAAQSGMRAFDPRNGVLILLNPANNEGWSESFIEPEEISGSNLSHADKLKYAEEIRETKRKTGAWDTPETGLKHKDPHKAFEGVHFVRTASSTHPDTSEFVFKKADGSGYFGMSYTFQGRRLLRRNWNYSPSIEDVSRWKKTDGWPKDWE